MGHLLTLLRMLMAADMAVHVYGSVMLYSCQLGCGIGCGVACTVVCKHPCTHRPCASLQSQMPTSRSVSKHAYLPFTSKHANQC